MNAHHKKLIQELMLSTAVTCVVLRLFIMLQAVPLAADYVSLFVALWLLYFPAWLMKRKGRLIDFVDVRFSVLKKNFFTYFIAALFVFIPFFFLSHFWMMWVQGSKGFHWVSFPGFLATLLTQILLVALPEEYFFRGYFQSTLNKVFAPRWNVLGVRLGWSWIITALVFAFAHSVIAVQWWHFAIFFPALLFGYLRERTGNLTASILMHATCNLFSSWLWMSYF